MYKYIDDGRKVALYVLVNADKLLVCSEKCFWNSYIAPLK